MALVRLTRRTKEKRPMKKGLLIGCLVLLPAAAWADINRDVDPGKESQFDCNVFGDTSVRVTNSTGASADYNITFANDRHENKSGTVPPNADKDEKIGCGGLGTPGLVFHNNSSVKVHVRTR
jgi:hypothetical protein